MFEKKEHVCGSCGHSKKYSEFYLKNYKPNGMCRECYKAYYRSKKNRNFAYAGFAALANLTMGV